jgi:exonuclease SbcC
MRIDRIEFEAIGPFAEYFDIDLNQLGDSALFLIDGPTGAGKSTILDAITYAIYGDTAGSESDKSRMRSQFAKPTQESWVRVTFSTPNGSYRVRRSPEFERAKSRGVGTTKVNVSGQFQKLDGSGNWVTEFEQAREASAAAEKAVGLTKTQFAQTVLLPQGEFDQFLKADSSERQELLSRIFNTGRFTKLREALKARAKKIDTDLASLNTIVSQRAGTIGTIFNMHEDDLETVESLAGDISKGDELIEFLNGYEEQLKKDLVELKARLKKSEAALKKANSDLELRNRELAAKTALDKATEEAKDSQEELNQNLKEATAQAKAHKFDLTGSESWQTRSQKVAASLAILEDLLVLEESLQERLDDAEDRADKLDDAKQLLKTYEEAALSLPNEKKKLDDEIKTLKPEAAKVTKLELEVESLSETATAIENLSQLNEKLPDLETKSIDSAQKALKAEEHRHLLMASRLANMAGELASDLVDGKPCEVCGATEHPNPKKLSKNTATQEEIDAAEGEFKKLAKRAEDARQELTTLKTQIDSISKSLKVNPDEFEQKFEKVSAGLEKAEEAANRIAVIEDELDSVNEKIQNNQELKTQISNKVTLQESELKAARTSITGDEKKIAAQASPYKSIAEKFEATEELAEAFNAVVESEGAVKAKLAVIKDRKTDFEKLEQTSDFAKPEKAQAAVDASKPVYEELLIEESAYEGCLESYTPALKKLESAIADRTKLLSGSEQVKNLAKIADGDNPFRQPIDTFVLQHMFRQVLAAGNLRFQNLLEGRYAFELDEVGTDGRSKQGLGLSVRDRNTGETRTTKTLSGGEGFCASLSLALGLSDIVRAESGGLAIDTFFIDEGFGSLDGERLNQVNNMLSRLQAEGRTIGLISHVAEMKDAIQEKIDVKPSKTEGPSRLTVNWMAGA